MENNDRNNTFEDTRRKHDADSGNDSTNEILQNEKLIDPGNKHRPQTRHQNRDTKTGAKHDADAGGDGTGTMGIRPE